MGTSNDLLDENCKPFATGGVMAQIVGDGLLKILPQPLDHEHKGMICRFATDALSLMILETINPIKFAVVHKLPSQTHFIKYKGTVSETNKRCKPALVKLLNEELKISK